MRAKWTPVSYTATFDSAGGTAVDPLSFTIESSLDNLPQPVRNGYRFLGWYDGKTKVAKLTKGTTGDRILTAKWEKINAMDVIDKILKEEDQKNRKEEEYTEDTWKKYQAAKKAAEEFLKETNPDLAKADQVPARLQDAIKGLTLKNGTTPTMTIEKTDVRPPNSTASTRSSTVQAKQYPRTNMVPTIWPGIIGTGLVATIVTLFKKKKKN